MIFSVLLTNMSVTFLGHIMDFLDEISCFHIARRNVMTLWDPKPQSSRPVLCHRARFFARMLTAVATDVFQN